MVDGVGMPVESRQPDPDQQGHAMQLRMLGPLAISRDGTDLVLPASRKVRALIAYLSLAPRAVPRSQLCDLLWDVPNDPRGELRWCLSKIRSLLDQPGRLRVEAQRDAVRLDLSDCYVDSIAVTSATDSLADATTTQLRHVAGLFSGDFLGGLEIGRSTGFSSWLSAQRRHFRRRHIATLERLVGQVADAEALQYLEQWLELAPFDARVHAQLLGVLARQGQMREGEEHLAATARQFAAEGLNDTVIRQAWHALKEARHHRSGTALATDPAPHAGTVSQGSSTATGRRASIAVMPFVDSTVGARAGVGDALVHDIIIRLAKLRSLFVIARGTVFALRDREVGPEEAGRLLDVDYVVAGSLRNVDGRLRVTVELTEARAARIIWTDVVEQKAVDTFLVLEEIGNRIVASIATEIEVTERNRAVLKPPNSLDSWEAHHRGLWHMYRFSRADNEQARHFFGMAVRLDPTFARAHAGLSFTHFQNAFQGWTSREPEIDRAFEAAGQSLMADDRDPAAHWAMGRALWLRGRHDQSLVELQQAVDLSPNFALGHYTLAFVQSQAGDAEAAIASSDHSRLLSPFDPLLFGMLGSRAMALVRLRRFDEAAEWGMRAAARPNAHAHILAIGALCLSLADRLDEAHTHLAALHRVLPSYRLEDFLAAMRFSPDGEQLFRTGAKRIGIG